MHKFCHTLFPLIVLLLAVPATEAQRCPLPAAFDEGAVYSSEIFVSTTGDDTSPGDRDTPLRTLQEASRRASPGTDIILLAGEHQTGQSIPHLQGTADQPIRIRGVDRDSVFFTGGNQAIHLVEPAYVVLEGFTVRQASANGLNVDDGGSYETPAHHVTLRNLRVQDIGPRGNRDCIKLSGLDHFRVEDCMLIRGADGGSGVDMVGCHDGVITRNRFEQMGSNGIQAKGGTARILIYANRFTDAGQRAVNMGGSTGLAFFRPIDAPFEAANIIVGANLFVGGVTPIGFVGCENGLFAHNVILGAERWALRILQETVGERFIPCRNNVIVNNMFVVNEDVASLVNIGPNTQPETFRFLHNAWFREGQPLSRPDLPGDHRGNLWQVDPLFRTEGVELRETSPLLRAGVAIVDAIEGLPITQPHLGDLNGYCFDDPPDIGALHHPASNPDWPLDQ